MSDVFVLVNANKQSDREDCVAVDRQVGENFLKNYSGCRAPEYKGYIVFEGNLVPFWNVCCGMTEFIEERARIELTGLGYIGRVIKKDN